MKHRNHGWKAHHYQGWVDMASSERTRTAKKKIKETTPSFCCIYITFLHNFKDDGLWPTPKLLQTIDPSQERIHHKKESNTVNKLHEFECHPPMHSKFQNLRMKRSVILVASTRIVGEHNIFTPKEQCFGRKSLITRQASQKLSEHFRNEIQYNYPNSQTTTLMLQFNK